MATSNSAFKLQLLRDDLAAAERIRGRLTPAERAELDLRAEARARAFARRQPGQSFRELYEAELLALKSAAA